MRCEWHETEKTVTLTEGALQAQGIYYERVSLDAKGVGEALRRLQKMGGYIEQDTVTLKPDNPRLDSILEQFKDEHRHTEDEVRLILEGEGIFDIRDADNNTADWMRVWVEAGDLIVVPAGRYHRFFLTDKRTIKAVRLFKDAAGWVADYR